MHLCCFIAGKNSCDLGVFFARKLGCVKILPNFMTERRCMENSTLRFYANGEPFSNELNRAKEIRKPRKDAKTFFYELIMVNTKCENSESENVNACPTYTKVGFFDSYVILVPINLVHRRK